MEELYFLKNWPLVRSVGQGQLFTRAEKQNIIAAIGLFIMGCSLDTYSVKKLAQRKTLQLLM